MLKQCFWQKNMDVKTEHIPLLTHLTPSEAHSMLNISLYWLMLCFMVQNVLFLWYMVTVYMKLSEHIPNNVPARMHDHRISLSLLFILSESFVPFHFICAGIPRFHTSPCQMGEWRHFCSEIWFSQDFSLKCRKVGELTRAL